MHALIAAALFVVIASSPTWSPDGDSIAYSQRLPGVPERAQLIVTSVRDGTKRVLAAEGYNPQWSPGGSLAYVAREGHSGNVAELRIAEVSLFGRGNYFVADGVTNFAWSWNGMELYYDEGWRTCGHIHAVSSYDLTQRRVVVIGASPAPSPFGSRIAYFTAVHGACTGGFGAVSVANSDGTHQRVVYDDPATRVGWSPDGRRLAIESRSNIGAPTITVMDADGSNAHIAAIGTHPAWSRDGRYLASLSYPRVDAPFPRDEPYLQITDMVTGFEQRSLSASAENGGPAWSPTADTIALSRALERGGRTEGLAPGLNRSVSLYMVPLAAPTKARRISVSACQLLRPACTLSGGPGGNVLVGTTRRDVIWGYGGDDRISAGRGNDELHGGSGNDELAGGPGRDVIVGGSGGDVVFARDGRHDAIFCGSGYDTVIADADDDAARDCERVVR